MLETLDKWWRVCQYLRGSSRVLTGPVVYYDLPLENAKATWAASGWSLIPWVNCILTSIKRKKKKNIIKEELTHQRLTIHKLGHTTGASNDVRNIIGLFDSTLSHHLLVSSFLLFFFLPFCSFSDLFVATELFKTRYTFKYFYIPTYNDTNSYIRLDSECVILTRRR